MPSGATNSAAAGPAPWPAFFAGSDPIACPSGSTRPGVGLSSRDNARSNVDLPHTWGPTIIVNE
jgi:hypothetical protein